MENLRGNSGWHWTDENGARITLLTKATWDAYVKVHRGAEPFRNQGWPLWDLMHQLMPHEGQGKHVYNPSQLPEELEQNLQQDEDLSYNGESQEWDIC